MSFIKSDSLLSDIKNVSIRIQMRPNDGSNIFKSIYENKNERQKSINLGSFIDFQSGILCSVPQGTSLIDKLTSPSSKQYQPAFKQYAPAFKQYVPASNHYNWLVCKSAGLSQEQDNQDIQSIKSQEQKQNNSISEIKISQKQQMASNSISISDEKKIKNETKNIPKNYGKAIICFIERYHFKVLKITAKYGVDYKLLLQDMKKKKKSINTIADLRDLWSKYKYAQCMRVISYQFFRRHALSYIFDSRICTYASHIKYRQRLCEAVSNPEHFKHIKDY